MFLLNSAISIFAIKEVAPTNQTRIDPPDYLGAGYTQEELKSPQSIGFRTENPGPFLSWPLPSNILRTAVSVIPDSPWTHHFLGISSCPPYPPMIDDYNWVDPNNNPIFYSGQFNNYALPGTSKDRVRFLNTDDTGLLYNFFACYSASPSWGLLDHAGTDISAPNGTNVLATAYADQINVVIDSSGDYRIRLRHPDINGSGQTWYTYYVHLSSANYSVGTYYPTNGISQGEIIGGVGRNHLHFQAGIDGSYSNVGARNIWGIDESPWNGCLWVNSAICTSTSSGLNMGDSDGDGKSDLFKIQSSDERYLVWLSSGAKFYQIQQWYDGSYDYGTYRFMIADVNGDGKEDVVGMDANDERFVVWLSNGSGFNPGQQWYNGSFDYSAYQFNLADVNGDGKKDVVGIGANDERFVVWLSNGSGFNQGQQWYNGVYNYSAYQFNLADVNGDGKEDIVGIGANDERYLVWLSNGSGFNQGQQWYNGIYDYSTYQFDLADVNGDGKKDVVGIGVNDERYLVWLSNGSGFNQGQQWYNGVYDYSAYQFGLADVNGDGKEDITGFRPSDERIVVWISSGSNFNNGQDWTPMFPPPTSTPVPPPTPTNTSPPTSTPVPPPTPTNTSPPTSTPIPSPTPTSTSVPLNHKIYLPVVIKAIPEK